MAAVRGAKEFIRYSKGVRASINSMSPIDTVNKGYQYAKRKAPVANDSLGGGTRAAIRRVKRKKSASLIADQPRRRPGNRPYHLWMHGIGRYNIFDDIIHGDPRFMFTAREIMADHASKSFIKKIKSKV